MSHLWLSARLRRFNDRFPEISIRLTTTDNLSELAQAESKVALIYSRGSHPDWTLTTLLREELIPVAAPSYIASAASNSDPAELSPQDLSGLDLYDYSRSGVHSITLQDWFKTMGPEGLPKSPNVVFPTYMMAVDAALRGDGIILGSRALIKPHLDSGALVELTSDVMTTGFGYYLGLPRHATIAEAEKTLAEFLLAEKLI